MRAFEIQIYQGGKWNIDSIFDDRELAMYEAQRMDESGRYVGIRVVEETFDEGTEKTASRTIFRGSRVDQINNQHFQQRREVRDQVLNDRKRRNQERSARQKSRVAQAKKKKSSPVRLIVLLAVIGAFAIGALIGLRYLQDYL